VDSSQAALVAQCLALSTRVADLDRAYRRLLRSPLCPSGTPERFRSALLLALERFSSAQSQEVVQVWRSPSQLGPPVARPDSTRTSRIITLPPGL